MSMNNDDKEQLEYIRAWVQQKKQREVHKQITYPQNRKAKNQISFPNGVSLAD